MIHSEVIERIRTITARSRAYAIEHAEEIKQRQEENARNSENFIAEILLDAKNAVKHSWSIYEIFRSRISTAASNSEQYEIAIQRLASILEV